MESADEEGAPERFCPSARCEVGTLLLGLVGPDGVVGFLTPPLRVDAAFVQHTHQGRPPGRRFRFAGRCVEAGCMHWTGYRCGVIDVAVEGLGAPGANAMRPCVIRPACQWFGQHGTSDCAVCPLIVTELPPRDE